MFDLSLKAAKSNFFDRAKVIGAVNAGRRKVLSKIGAFVRTRARSSIRKRKGISPPGHAPYSHLDLIRRFLFFSYDKERGSVVIGPTRIGGTVDSRALEALEHGGTSTMQDKSGKRHAVTVRARPFMGPALAAEKPGFPAMWRDSVR